MRELTTQFLIAIQEASSLMDEKPMDPDIWAWSNDLRTNGGFALTDQKTYLLLLEEHAKWQMLNMRWGRKNFEEIWPKRWKRI